MDPVYFDAEKFGAAIGELIREKVEPLEKRLAQLEATGIKFCGTHQRAMAYERGSVVVCNGSPWVALKAAVTCAPGEGADWALLARAGRDGKDAR